VELYNILGQTIEQYRIRLLNEADLQINFINAKDSIESYVRPISAGDTKRSGEAQYLLSQSGQTNTVKFF
jgi:hypothetical protein